MFTRLRKLDRLERELDRLVDTSPVDAPVVNTDDLRSLELLALVPALRDDLERPDWLAPWAAKYEQALTAPVRAVGATPPQHGKTVLTEAGLLHHALKVPGRKHAYVTYSVERANYVSTELQRLAQDIGLSPSGRLSDVLLNGGTRIRFTSVGGSFTGFPVDGLLILDDCHKDRAEAESPTIRQGIIDWFSGVARARRAPTTSILCMATRWVPEDLSGHLIGKGYEYVNLKAIADGALDEEGRVADDPLHRLPGQSLWSFKPPEFFTEEREDDYTWESQYQGNPRPRGDVLFHWPDLPKLSFTEQPPSVRYAIGLDFASSIKTRADYSVAVVLAEFLGNYYVLEVVRVQTDPRTFRARVQELLLRYPGAHAAAYVPGTELGSVEFVRDIGLPITAFPARVDKFQRALKTAASWNSGRFRFPASAPWLSTFVQEVSSFTGVPGRRDDQVDALVAAHDVLRTTVIDWETIDQLRESLPRPLEL